MGREGGFEGGAEGFVRAVGSEKGDGIGIGGKSCTGLGEVVDDDEIAVFSSEFGAGVGLKVFGLGGEAHHGLVEFAFGEGGEDVAGRLEFEREASGGFFFFLRQAAGGSEIADGGRHDADIAGVEEGIGLMVHFLRAHNRVKDGAVGFREAHRAGNEIDIPAEAEGGLGKGVAHLSGRGVAEKTDRVEELAGGTGGDEAADRACI